MIEINQNKLNNELKLLKPDEVARILNCSRAYPYLLAERGLIPVVKIPSPSKAKHLIRFRFQDIMDFIESHYRKP